MTPLASFIVGMMLGGICASALIFWGLDQRLLKESHRGIDTCVRPEGGAK